MKNIIKPFLDEHAREFELQKREDERFEHLVNYLTMRNFTSRHFDPADASLGEGEIGIDGIAIIVNDILVTSYEEVASIFTDEQSGKNVRDIAVSIVFTQAKTSEKFELSEYSHFLSAVFDFVSQGSFNDTPKALELQKIYKYIIEHPTQLVRNPDCHIFYAYTGSFEVQESITKLMHSKRDELIERHVFDEINLNIYDSTKIVAIYRGIKNSIEKTVTMENCSIIPQIDNISEAFLGTVRCSDYVDLITNDDGILMSNLFEDNVRYFQGHNKVNSEIKLTITDSIKQQAFSLLNNGVTIIAEDIRRTANSFVLKNFQIVNGCQTSFVLYENRKSLKDKSFIVVKLISSKDKNLADSIVRTTNRQTPITDESFETLRDFHKNLEIAYSVYDSEYRLYYERRSKQYESSDINKSRIVSFPYQTSSYVAMFLGEPHSTHRYYGELLKSYKTRMYQEEDVLEQYCISSMYVYYIDKYLRDREMNDYRKYYKFHIALLSRLLVSPEKLPKANSKKMKTLCADLYKVLSNRVEFEDKIERAITAIDNVLAQREELVVKGNPIYRTLKFTNSIVEQLGIMDQDYAIDRTTIPIKVGSEFQCKVTGWNQAFAYVQIIEHKEAASIYIGNITSEYVHNIADVLKMGEVIKAKIVNDIAHPIYGYEMSMVQ